MTQTQPGAEKAKQAKKANPFLTDLGAFTQPEALDGWLHSGETLMKGAFEFTRQCVEFGEVRMREDFKILETLMGCKDLDQLAHCQKAFADKARKQYFEQFNGMAKHWAGLMTPPSGAGPTDAPPLAD